MYSSGISKKNSKYELYIETKPKNATIRIMNIKPKFKQGIILKRGKYEIEISAKGYKTRKEWITLKRNAKYEVKLDLDIEYYMKLCTDKQKTIKKCSDIAVNFFDNGLKLFNKNKYQDALKYYDNGCKLYNHQSCLNLGVMKFYAEGTDEDIEDAKKLFNKACNLGNKKACENILRLKKLDLK